MVDKATLKLGCNIPVTIQGAASESNPRYPAMLYGNIGEELLMIGGPDLPVFAVREEIVVRTVIEGQAIAFRTMVEATIERPRRLIFAGYPVETASTDLRRSDRIRVFVPADIRAETTRGDEPETLLLKSIVVNLSGGGCCVSCRRPLEPSSEINVSFALPGETYVHSLAGKVLSRQRKEFGYALRVRFPNMPGNILGLGEISRWVAQYAGYSLA